MRIFRSWFYFLFAMALLLDAHAAEKFPTAPLKMLVVGDSLSAAYKLKAEQGWVAQLDKHFPEVIVTNAAVSGLTTQGGVGILTHHLSQQVFDLVVIELGANDGLQGKPIQMIHNNIEAMVKQAKETGAHVVLFEMQMPPNRGRRYTEPFREIYHGIADQEQVQLVPFFMAPIIGNRALMMDDQLHPSAEGQDVLTKTLIRHFEQAVNHAR